MTDDTKPVPEPGEAQRDGDDIHYFEVDETNVGESDGRDEPDSAPQSDSAARG